MKKILLCACLVALLHPAVAQFYVRANVGYNLPLGSTLLGVNETETGGEGVYTGKYEGVYGTYGTGFSAGIAFGGSFKNSQLGYDLAVNYLSGKEYSAASVYKGDDYTNSYESSAKATSFQVNPSLTFTIATDKFQPFARFGPVIGFTKLKQEETDKTSTLTTPRAIMGLEYTGGISLGFKGSVGVNYVISEQLKLFTEINFLSMSYGPKTQELTKLIVDGENRLDDIPAEDRKVDLEKEYSFDDDSEGEDDTDIRQPFNMNSWGIQVGVQFSFGQ